ACRRLVVVREVDLGIRGALLLLDGLGRSGPWLHLRVRNFACLIMLFLPLPLPGSGRLCRVLLLLRLLCVQAVDFAFLRDRRPRGVAPAAQPLRTATKSESGSGER